MILNKNSLKSLLQQKAPKSPKVDLFFFIFIIYYLEKIQSK